MQSLHAQLSHFGIQLLRFGHFRQAETCARNASPSRFDDPSHWDCSRNVLSAWRTWGLIGSLALLRGYQIHTLRLLVQRRRELAVDLKLLNDAAGQVRAVFRQQFGASSARSAFALPLAVKLITQGLQICIQLFALLLRQLRAHPRQLLAVIGGELRQLQFIDKGFEASRFGLQPQILRLRLRRVAALRANATLNFIKLAAGIGLLLGKLAERVGNFTRPLLLLLSQTALSRSAGC